MKRNHTRTPDQIGNKTAHLNVTHDQFMKPWFHLY